MSDLVMINMSGSTFYMHRQQSQIMKHEIILLMKTVHQVKQEVFGFFFCSNWEVNVTEN